MMTSRSKWLPVKIVCGFALLAAASCGECEIEDPAKPVPQVSCPSDIALTSTDFTLALWRSRTIAVVNGISTCPVAWSVDDESILDMDSWNTGATVRALGVGSTTLRARREDRVAVCRVTVVRNAIVGFATIPDTLALVAGDSVGLGVLGAQLIDEGGVGINPSAEVAWSLADTTVARFAVTSPAAVLVMGKAPGQTLVAATYSGPETPGTTYRDTSVVMVSPPEEP